MMARIALLLLSTLLVTILAQDEIAIKTILPNSPSLYLDDVVTVRCNGGDVGPSPDQLLIEFDDYEGKRYGCGLSGGETTFITDVTDYIISINPNSRAQCQAVFDGEYQLEFTPRQAGLKYRCRTADLTDNLRKYSQNQTLPPVLSELPTDTSLTVNGSNFYEGSELNVLCSIDGGVPVTTRFLYALNGQTHNVSGPLTLRLTQDMAGEITCTSTEHVHYINRTQPSLVSSPLTVNIYYLKLNTAAETKREFNPSFTNPLNCESLISTNLMSADITYVWTSNDGILANNSILVLPVNGNIQDTTISYTCDISGPLFRDTDTDFNTLEVVIDVTWSLLATTTPIPTTTSKPANAAAIGAGVGVGFVVIVILVAVIVCWRNGMFCFKKNRPGDSKHRLPPVGSNNPGPAGHAESKDHQSIPMTDDASDATSTDKPSTAQYQSDALIYAELDHSGASQTPVKSPIQLDPDNDGVIYTQVNVPSKRGNRVPQKAGPQDEREAKAPPVRPRRSQRSQ